jgi:hypothetical protein
VLYLSYWYDKYDLPIRLAIFYTINPLTEIVTSFLGAGLLQMRGVLGYAGWRWMFLLEGLATLVIGSEYRDISSPTWGNPLSRIILDDACRPLKDQDMVPTKRDRHRSREQDHCQPSPAG